MHSQSLRVQRNIVGYLGQSPETAINRVQLADALPGTSQGQGRLPQEEHDGRQNGSHADDSDLEDVHRETEDEVGKSRLLEELKDSGDEIC